MIQPPILIKNDKAVIISPAGNIEAELIKGAASVLSKWGLLANVSPHAQSRAGRFSGTVEERLSDLQNALDDNSIKLILCSRGGYGLMHLIDKLDFSKIKLAPKWIIGFSDITALHSVLQTNGIMSIHGPMAKHLTEEGESDSAVKYMKSILDGNNIIYKIESNRFTDINKHGKAEGILFGGNLSVFCGLLGSDLIYIPRKGILVLEDISELPYKVDRYIHQLKLSGIFNKISGLIIGQFSDYEEDEGMYSPLYESISKSLQEYTFPICFDFPTGHVKENYPVIMGKKATLEVTEDYTTFTQTL